MPSLELAAVAPTLSAAAAAAIAIGLRLRAGAVPLDTTLWALSAGLAGGALATAGLSGEFLGRGAGGLLAPALGALLATGAVVEGLASREAPAATVRPAPPRAWRLPSPHAWLVAAGALVVPLLAAGVGLGLAAVLVLLAMAAAALTRAGWSFASGLFLAASVVSAAQVVVGVLVGSPLGLVGRPVAVVGVTALAVLPLTVRAAERQTLVDAARRVGLVDGVALAVGAATAAGWWSVFRGLGRSDAIAQVVRLGEDNIVHLLLLDVTRASGAAVGAGGAAQESLAHFAGYFPGPSLWQTALGSLLPPMTSTRLYLVSTAVLLGLLATGATAVAGSAARRLGVLSALGALAVGVVGSRLLLAFFELGFPGQLLVTIWVVAALTLVLPASTHPAPRWWATAGLVLFVPATVWSWSLAVPVLATPLGVQLVTALRARARLPHRVLVRLAVAGVLAGVAGAVLVRHRLLAALDLLNLNGPVYRAVPLWLAFGLVLALPFALRVRRRATPPPATGLVLAMALGTWGLMVWHLIRLGELSYYTYKLVYLLCALGWASAALLVAALNRDREATLPAAAVGIGGLVFVVAVPLLLTWPSANYQAWLAERGVLGPDAATSCAIAAASSAAPGSTALAVGFGSAIDDYLATKAMMVGTGNDHVVPFLPPQIQGAPPSRWPWRPSPGPVLVVPGADATPASTAAVVEAGEAGGAAVTVADACPEGAGHRAAR